MSSQSVLEGAQSVLEGDEEEGDEEAQPVPQSDEEGQSVTEGGKGAQHFPAEGPEPPIIASEKTKALVREAFGSSSDDDDVDKIGEFEVEIAKNISMVALSLSLSLSLSL